MANPFSPPTITQYNANPPPDDGTQTDANEITWEKQKVKLTDPLKTAIEATITNTNAAFAKVIGGAGVTSYGTSSTVQASDQGKLVRATNSGITITTPDAASVESPFVFALLNDSGGDITFDGSGSQTIDGDASRTVPDGNSFFLFTDGSNWFTAGRSGLVNKYDATAAPAATNDVDEGYSVGSAWVDVTNDQAYICVGASDGAAVWRKTGGAGSVIQVVHTQTGAVATGTTTAPGDDTIPQNDEGDEYMTLAITPTDANNILIIEVVGNFAHSSTGGYLTVALFQDSTADAIAAVLDRLDTANRSVVTSFRHKMTTGTTSETTFKVRAGLGAAGTTTFNGHTGARKLGGVIASSITITEIQA